MTKWQRVDAADPIFRWSRHTIPAYLRARFFKIDNRLVMVRRVISDYAAWVE